MTLRVTIKHDQPDYPLSAKVQVFDLNDLREDIDAPAKSTHMLYDGDEISLYVYDIQQLIISEGPAKEGADTGMPAAPPIHGAALKNPPDMSEFTHEEMSRMPADGFVQPGEVCQDGQTIQTVESLAAIRAAVKAGPPVQEIVEHDADGNVVQPPADDAFVAVGATRFSDGQIQTDESLATAKAIWATAHPA